MKLFPLQCPEQDESLSSNEAILVIQTSASHSVSQHADVAVLQSDERDREREGEGGRDRDRRGEIGRV